MRMNEGQMGLGLAEELVERGLAVIENTFFYIVADTKNHKNMLTGQG